MGELAKGCPGLASTINSHIEGLTALVTELSNKNPASALSSRSSLVESLTALAETLDLMARISPEPLASNYRHQGVAALVRAIDDLHWFSHEDFTVVGIALGVRCSKPD